MTACVPDKGSSGAKEKTFFAVTKGNPTEEEIGIMSAIFASLLASSPAFTQSHEERNLWGNYAERLSQRAPHYNASAFRNVQFY